MNDLSREIMAYALKNALEFDSADASKVLPKLFKHGLTKNEIGAVMPKIKEVVMEVNALSVEERAKDFEKLKCLVKEHEEKEKKLPDLPNAGKNVVTRIPPEPSKYLHLGHALTFLINYTYAQKHGGKCLIRLEDANPERVTKEFVDLILEDLREYLEIPTDSVSYVSDDMEILYSYAEKLITKKAAYMCFCNRERMQELRHAGTECTCRMQSVEKNFKHWNAFIAGKYKEGESVLRFKGNMQSDNHVMRDSALFRVVTAKHFRHKTKYKAWPLYDFYNPIEDSISGVTHVLRSMEFDLRVELHEQIKKLLGLCEQTVVQYGRFNVIGAETQGREIRAKVESGEYSGFDDPRLVTLRALRRRGIRRDVLLELINHIGLSKKQIHIDFALIASISRKLLDKNTQRYYFVASPVKLKIGGAPSAPSEVAIKLYPDREDTRKLNIGKEIFIAQSDYDAFKGQDIRLMNLYNLKLDAKPVFTGLENKRIQKIQWVSTGAVKVKIRMDTGAWIPGLGEPALKKLKTGDIVQFERFGFVRFDTKGKSGLEFWFAHQ